MTWKTFRIVFEGFRNRGIYAMIALLRIDNREPPGRACLYEWVRRIHKNGRTGGRR